MVTIGKRRLLQTKDIEAFGQRKSRCIAKKIEAYRKRTPFGLQKDSF